MRIPAAFEALSMHPAPGLHFPPHEWAKLPERVVPTPHYFWSPASASALKVLRNRTKACPKLQAELVAFYSRWKGVAFCAPHDPQSGMASPALTIYPVEDWAQLTARLAGELRWMLNGLEKMYVRGRYFVFAASPSEDTLLTLFTEGTFKRRSLAGKVFYLSMDPVLSFTEPVADSFFALLDTFAGDPAAFLARIGYTHVAKGKGGMYGAVPDRYVADCGKKVGQPDTPSRRRRKRP